MRPVPLLYRSVICCEVSTRLYRNHSSRRPVAPPLTSPKFMLPELTEGSVVPVLLYTVPLLRRILHAFVEAV